jgi:hypothetical protein
LSPMAEPCWLDTLKDSILGYSISALQALPFIEHLSPALRVTYPVMWPDGDYVEVYVRRKRGGRFEITDDGETRRRIGDFFPSVPDELWMQIAGAICQHCGVMGRGNELLIDCAASEVKHQVGVLAVASAWIIGASIWAATAMEVSQRAELG